ncbi:extracellular solute-binding protein [Vallitalea guaymasensis]|uniref:extracellular solute-binding protein n=1 Tax=Vallitalea guaymasensis TaxID=1185412 RepID=UPI000DE1F94A|nr:extracellular solute-binding protein [Vallitalea guaymasensis]
MHFFKQSIAVVLTFMIISTVLTGCAQSKETDIEKDVLQKISNPYEEKLEISISFWGIENSFRKGVDDALLKEVEEKFNVTFKVIPTAWSDWSEKYITYAASGELPDVFAHDIIGNSIYHNWIKEGLIRSIPEDLSKYPNVQKIFNQADAKKTKYVDGNYYMIPRQTYKSVNRWALDRVIMVRKDWMENLGISDPQNFEEFKAMLKAFVEDDPDNNGKDDTIGLVINNMNFAALLFLGSYPELSNIPRCWVKEDSKWMPAYANRKAIDAIGQLKELYQEGLLYKNFAIANTEDAKNKFAEGKAGVFFYGNSYNYIPDMWDRYNPDQNFLDSVKYLHMWPAPDGNIYKYTEATWWSESYFSSKCSDEKMERILAIYDWTLSEEGSLTCRLGIKGKDWDVKNGEIVITRPKDENGNFINMFEYYPSFEVLSNMAAWQQDIMYEKNALNNSICGEDIVDMSIREMAWHDNNAKIVNYNYDIVFMSTPAKDRLSRVNINDEIVKIILSEKSVEEAYNDMIDRLNENGLQEAINEVTAKAAQLGY